MTPAEELKAAAAKLRELAADAKPGPWTLYREWDEWDVKSSGPLPSTDINGPWVTDRDSEYGDPGIRDVEDARWIATMSPAVAEPLARWLDLYANKARVEPTGHPDFTPPLALARQINKSVSGD